MPLSRYPRQLLLDLNLGYSQTFGNFIVGKNKLLCDTLLMLHPFEYGYDYSLCCWSETSNGKSHLMRAYCAYWQELGITVNYLSGGNLTLDKIDINSNQLAVMVFDDIHHSVGNQEKEEDILHLLLSCYEKDIPFVCSSLDHPSKLNFAMNDLATRLGAFYSFEVEPLMGEDLAKFIGIEANRLGLNLDTEQIDIISSRSNEKGAMKGDMKIVASLLKKLAHKNRNSQGRLLTAEDIELASASLHH